MRARPACRSSRIGLALLRADTDVAVPEIELQIRPAPALPSRAFAAAAVCGDLHRVEDAVRAADVGEQCDAEE